MCEVCSEVSNSSLCNAEDLLESSAVAAVEFFVGVVYRRHELGVKASESKESVWAGELWVPSLVMPGDLYWLKVEWLWLNVLSIFLKPHRFS